MASSGHEILFSLFLIICTIHKNGDKQFLVEIKLWKDLFNAVVMLIFLDTIEGISRNSKDQQKMKM